MDNLFVTKKSKHCYYGNVTNILNYYGEDISESELILLSNALNCTLEFGENLFLGISNKLCEIGIKRLGYHMCLINKEYSAYQKIFLNNIPILLYINTNILNYNDIFNGTDRTHYIILLKDGNETIEISDSFVLTIPISIFHGDIDLKPIKIEIQSARALGVYLSKINKNEEPYSFKRLIYEFIEMNAIITDNSIINILKDYCSTALHNADILLNKDSLNYLSFDIKVAGVVTRFDYMAELIKKHLFNYSIDVTVLGFLKSKWELISSKLLKCSITLNSEYYTKIFEIEIPILIEKELHFYQEVYEKIKSLK